MKVRKRIKLDNGSMKRPKKVNIRVRPCVSARLASIQGLCVSFGKRETLASLFEEVCIPALEKHVAPYAEAARKHREEERKEEK